MNTRMGQLIEFDRVSFHYETADGMVFPALRDISLSISSGEWVSVIGANGSGKSTFARMVSALLLPKSGRVRIDNLDTSLPANRPRIHATVGTVFQFPEDQIVSTTVEEDVAFGPQNLALPPDEIRARVDKALNEVGLWEARRRPPHMLSAGQIQRLALAGVLAMHPRCIVFDEASTMLDPMGRQALMQSMRRLNDEGITIIFITHFMEEAAQAARVIVFDHGRLAMDGSPAEIFADQARLKELRIDLPPAGRLARRLREAIPGLSGNLLTLPDLIEALPRYPGAGGSNPTGQETIPAAAGHDPALIDVQALGHVYLQGTPLEQRALNGVNLRVLEGRSHGLLGMTGSGKSTLLQHLNALLRPQEGRVRVAEFDLNDAHLDRRTVIGKVGLVFQNPEAQFFEYFVGDEIAYGPRQLMKADPSGPMLGERVRWAMDQVGLDFAGFKDRPLFGLSGGERRKVALASTLALRPSILLLDEPTAGLDPFSRQDLIDKLMSMRAAGMALVLSSHQMEDLAVLADDLTVFKGGRDVMNGPAAAILTQEERLAEYSLEMPPAARLAEALRERGWPIPATCMTGYQVARAVAQGVGAV